jgi:hypothetical protein
MRRRELLAAAMGALLAATLAGGIAWATIPEAGVIQGCYDSGGNLKVVSALPCPKGYTPLQWNQQGIQGIPGPKGNKGDPGLNGTNGTNGQDGVSVTSTALSPGDANCPDGGSQFTAVNGMTYACNGAQGPPGPGSDVLIANVNSDGTLAPGSDASSSFHPLVGTYALTFARSTSNCSSTVSASAASPRIGVTSHSGDAVFADFFSATGAQVDTAFHLILVC